MIATNVELADEQIPLELLDGPTDSELWAIEAEAELLDAEVALVDAEAAWLTERSPRAAAAHLQALLDVVDLRHMAGHEPRGAVA